MPVRIKGRLIRSTQRAVAIDMSEDMGGLEISTGEVTWLPFSQLEGIYDFSSIANGTEIELVISDWIARQKNIRSNIEEVDMERYKVVTLIHGWAVNDCSTQPALEEMCICNNPRTANMIAAALNMTQGKV